jgi:chorismate synthase
MSLPAIKGVEIGDGFEAATRLGSQVHDPILSGFVRPTNHAGGLEGGITNGETLVARGAMKPIATLMKPLPSVDLRTGQLVEAATERSDVCAVEAAAVVAEARIAYVLAGAWVEKFGGDSVAECRRNYESYVKGASSGGQNR